MSIDDAMNDVEQAVRDVEQAVERVEKAVKDKQSTIGAIFIIAIAIALVSYVENTWHSKWRYALTYGIDSDKVVKDKEPHDCDFLAAPLGTKYCRYEVQVSTIRWATSTTGTPIESTDEGKTWTTFTPEANATVPRQSTVEY